MNTSSDNFYLKKYSNGNQEVFTPPENDLNIVVVIPCHSEPELLASLDSLNSAHPPSCAVEVLVVINYSEKHDDATKKMNQDTYAKATDWSSKNTTSRIQYHIIKAFDLPKKHAGVGLARKIGMDEAVRRLESVKSKKGIIVCFDADSLVVPNYLVAIEEHFKQQPKSVGCSIHFEHPLKGDLDSIHYQGIINYEMHLRYYIHALEFANYPYAFQTIGSSMAVRNYVYQKQGGMNKRKAGEDFYFLHKIIPLGNFTSITNTKTIPSPRQSDRVPFGTGKAIGDYISQDDQASYLSYNFNSFKDLKELTAAVPSWYRNKSIDTSTLPESIQKYLIAHQFLLHITLINKHSASVITFVKRFYDWFDGLMVLKFIHYARDHYHANQDIRDCVTHWNLDVKKFVITDQSSKKDLLIQQRLLDTNKE